VPQEPELSGFFLVIFDEIEPPDKEDTPEPEVHLPAVAARELETELDLTKKRLQAVIEDHEFDRERMQASLEELNSSNEELRSTMEELETSKEELQSINEELKTVNQENRHHIEELHDLTTDLQNLSAATKIPTLFLDREMRILRFTPPMNEIFNIRNTDQGRPLFELSHRLVGHNLQDDARQVLERLVPIEREIATVKTTSGILHGCFPTGQKATASAASLSPFLI
jgi:two-component system, chemotaxis family, CheB/CheR fusion protein